MGRWRVTRRHRGETWGHNIAERVVPIPRAPRGYNYSDIQVGKKGIRLTAVRPVRIKK